MKYPTISRSFLSKLDVESDRQPGETFDQYRDRLNAIPPSERDIIEERRAIRRLARLAIDCDARGESEHSRSFYGAAVDRFKALSERDDTLAAAA